MKRCPRPFESDLPARLGSNWLCKFNHLMTLLMLLFVLVFFMGTLDVDAMKTFQTALRNGLSDVNSATRSKGVEGDALRVTPRTPEKQPTVLTGEENEDPGQRMNGERAVGFNRKLEVVLLKGNPE